MPLFVQLERRRRSTAWSARSPHRDFTVSIVFAGCRSCRCRRRAGRRSRCSPRRWSCTRPCRRRTARSDAFARRDARVARVAGRGRRERRCRVQVGGDAGRARRVLAAGAAAVAGAVGAAGRHALVGALVQRILSRRHGGAGADRSRQRARRAGARAGRRAADALRAEVVRALARRRAGLAVGELAAAHADADVGRHAVGRCAVQVVLQVGVAVSHRYGSQSERRHRPADARAVAGALRRQRRSDARAGGALRGRRPEAAGAGAVAHAVASRTSSPPSSRTAWRAWAPCRWRRCCTSRGCRRSRTTCTSPCSLVAAVPLRAEAGVALVRHRARRAGRLQRADARVADVGRDAVRVGRAGGPARRRRSCRTCTCRTSVVVAAAQTPAPLQSARRA